MENLKAKETKDKMLKEYLSSQLLYVEFTSYIENKIKNILIENEIKYQSLNSRVKSYDSLKNKLTEKIINGIHCNIKNLNDLSGVRVIFYNEDDLKSFNNIIYKEFNVESYRLSEDIMKYDGINITISLKKDINKFKGMLCEVQLTTVLSHAINEFGHNIIYKDVDELQSKDNKEYERIEKIFEKARKDILNVVASLEFINRRIDSIKIGTKNIELLLDKDFNKKLQEVKSLDELESIINKMIEIIPLVNEDEEKYKSIYDAGIIYSIVKKFSELPVEADNSLNYDTYEYKFKKLLEFLQYYKYLWIDDFKNIISILYEISINNNIVSKFDEFIKDLIVSDKADSSRGYGNYNIHEIAYSLIIDKEIDEYIRIKLAEYFCDINYNYCEKSSMNEVSLVSNKTNPNDNYKTKIYKSIYELLDIFLNKHSKDALHALLNINSNLERNANIFDYNPIYEFFSDNYDKIDIVSKNELYKSVCAWKNTKLKDSEFYKRLKKDNIQKLYAMLFNFFVDEIPGSKHSEREEFRKDYLDKYIKNFKKDNIEEIVVILNTMDNEETFNLNIINAEKVLVDIGSLKKFGEEIIKSKWNEYIFLGILNQDKDYKYIIDDEIKADKIIQAMFRIDNINLELLNKIMIFVEERKNDDLIFKLLRLIINNNDLINNNEYKKYLLNKIKEYNAINKGIMGKLLYNPDTEENIIEKYSYKDLKILIDNFRYSEFNRLNEYFLNDLFEKYPDDLRIILKQKITDKPNTNLHNFYGYISLADCSNYNEERYNNLSLCMEFLEKNDCYKISNYIHYLIGEYNDELGIDILKYLNENDNYNTYTNVINLCKILGTSISCWKIFEFIIQRVEENDEILNEIDCLLFDTGVVLGEYGLADAFNNKYLFLKSLKPKNDKLKKFVDSEIKEYKNLYQNEKNRRDKSIIIDKKKYMLENNKYDD